MVKIRTTAVLSIGGNAISHSKNLDNLLEAIYILSKKGNLVITHGNGPQVGQLMIHEKENLALLTAQTDAQIGLFLEKEIIRYFSSKKEIPKIETLLTRVLVDPKDKAFATPTKPIGRFYSKPPAKRSGEVFKKLIGGYRRVVPSPKPLKILELKLLKILLKERYIVIAGGGGGIPIFYKNKGLNFADAVLDKDYTSSLIAKSLGATSFFILTNVNGAYLNFKKSNQKLIGKITATQMALLIKSGMFEEGSMKPKLEAALDFVRSKKKVAAIGNLKSAKDVIKPKSCTIITP